MFKPVLTKGNDQMNGLRVHRTQYAKFPSKDELMISIKSSSPFNYIIYKKCFLNSYR